MPTNEKKAFLITGASGTIGAAIASELAKYCGSTLTLVCRNEQKGEKIRGIIIKQTGNPNVALELVDLSSKKEIFAFADRWQGSLHVLVNNAATTPAHRIETAEGLEMQFATNVMGYFWMMEAFQEILQRSAPARVVNVASYWAGDLDVGDLHFQRRSYNNNQAYRQSKQADRMLTKAFAEKWKGRGVSVNACHPGDVNSNLSKALGFGGHESPKEGARTPVWLALDPALDGSSGSYFEYMQEKHCPFSANHKVVEDLFNVCEKISLTFS